MKKITLLLLFVMAMCLAGSFSTWASAWGMPLGLAMALGAALGIAAFFIVDHQLHRKLASILPESDLPPGQYAKIGWQEFKDAVGVNLPLSSGGIAILMPLPLKVRGFSEVYLVAFSKEPKDVYQKADPWR